MAATATPHTTPTTVPDPPPADSAHKHTRQTQPNCFLDTVRNILKKCIDLFPLDGSILFKSLSESSETPDHRS